VIYGFSARFKRLAGPISLKTGLYECALPKDLRHFSNFNNAFANTQNILIMRIKNIALFG
tara:strand:- start:456 stop:635 length:180 start_codon:yes stop_codon:yes gene_type:complete